MTPSTIQFNPELDLTFERLVDVPAHLVWAAWTTPEHIKHWFTPAPWKTIDCEIDLRPGGIFRTTMQSPEGQSFPNTGCYLEVIPNQRLIWTNVFEPGYRPAATPAVPSGPFPFTAIIELEAQGNRTKYTATVLHGDPEGRRRHQEMGFHQGWGTALDQLVAYMRAK